MQSPETKYIFKIIISSLFSPNFQSLYFTKKKKEKNKISNDLLFFSIPNEHLCPPHFHLSTSSPLSFHLSFFVLYQSGSKYRVEPTFVFDSQKVVLQRKKNIALETVHRLKTEKNDRKGWIKIESQSCSPLYPRPFFTHVHTCKYLSAYSCSYFIFHLWIGAHAM